MGSVGVAQQHLPGPARRRPGAARLVQRCWRRPDSQAVTQVAAGPCRAADAGACSTHRTCGRHVTQILQSFFSHADHTCRRTIVSDATGDNPLARNNSYSPEFRSGRTAHLPRECRLVSGQQHKITAGEGRRRACAVARSQAPAVGTWDWRTRTMTSARCPVWRCPCSSSKSGHNVDEGMIWRGAPRREEPMTAPPIRRK